MGCSVESKAAVRGTHESAVMSCLGGFLSAVSARPVPVLTEGMHSHKAVMSLSTPALKPLGTHSNTLLTCAGSLFASLA